MQEIVKKPFLSSIYDEEQKLFSVYLEDRDETLYTIYYNIRLQGIINEESRSVDTNIPLDNYKIYRFANPYLNAENDVFKINYKNKSIGYIFPNAALEDNFIAGDFDEFMQAYKFYCVKYIIENFDYSKNDHNETLLISDLVDTNSIYFIICLPLIKQESFNLEMCFPSIAIRGYYYFSENTVANVMQLSTNPTDELHDLIENKFLDSRKSKSIHILPTKIDIENIQLLKLLYKKLLVENNNALFRFLILYQVIEFLVEEKIRDGINKVSAEKDNLSNFDFFQRMYEVNNTRFIINSLFENVSPDDKNEITNALRSFILQTSPGYSKNSTGDCLYDIRNLLFHDYKRIIEIDHGAVIGLIIQCEILIHHLINSLDTK